MEKSEAIRRRSRVSELLAVNGLALGALRIAVRSCMKLLDILWTVCWRNALAGCGRGTVIQYGTTFEYPRRVWLGDNVIIQRKVRFTSETATGELRLDNGVQINQRVRIDYTGGVHVGADTLVSEEVLILSHSHKDDPRSAPTPMAKTIGKGVWVGARAVLLEKCTYVGDLSTVGSGCVVAKPVPPSAVAIGNPCVIRMRQSG